MEKSAEQPCNITRTWRADLYGGWGDGSSATVKIATHIITLSADHRGGVTATIDGEAADLERAKGYLLWAKRDNRLDVLSTVCHEPPPPDPLTLCEPVIGKARAHTLHKIMGKLGLPHKQHYGLAAFAVDEPFPLGSLASLTEREARRVWAYLCGKYPQAREVAVQMNIRTNALSAA